MSQSLTADQWLRAHRTQLPSLVQLNLTWPFSHASPAVYPSVFQILDFITDMLESKGKFVSAISSIGIFLSLLSVPVLWRQAYTKKNPFFQNMLIISALDLWFNIFTLVMSIVLKRFRTDGSSSYWVMWAMAVCPGPTYCLSLASDLCALALAAEKCISVSEKALWYFSLSARKKRLIKTSTIWAIVLCSCLRLHYAVTLSVVSSGRSTPAYQYALNPLSTTTFKVVIAAVSDSVLPLVIFVLMMGFSAKLVALLIERRRLKPIEIDLSSSNRNRSKPPPTSTKTMAKVPNSAIVLTLILISFMFILNQSGYCIYTIGELIVFTTPMLSYEANDGDISYWYWTRKFLTQTECVSSIFELLSHSANFVFYAMLSRQFKGECVRVGKACKEGVKKVMRMGQ